MANGSTQDAREACCKAPEGFVCNVSLPGRRTPGALIYDVRALRVGIEPQRDGIAAGGSARLTIRLIAAQAAPLAPIAPPLAVAGEPVETVIPSPRPSQLFIGGRLRGAGRLHHDGRQQNR
jgi:hypothetical protein